MGQKIITAADQYLELDEWFREHRCRRILLVRDDSVRYLEGFNRHLEELRSQGVRIIEFSAFQPNPVYESIVKGVEVLRREHCDSIMAVGGGSAMDVAKCIKLYALQPGDGTDGAWLKAGEVPNDIPFMAMPTTAGTGSEATRYAVIYYEGEKQSITSKSIIPGAVLMNASVLRTLPLYQRKATMMDALCHAIESYWSVNSTCESKAFSREAIRGILNNMDAYLANDERGNHEMLLAAHAAGQAIDITQTTAGHAMCYKITSMFHVAHGHAAILCDRVLFPWMIDNTDCCVDPRGESYLIPILDELGHAMGGRNAHEASVILNEIFMRLELAVPSASADQFEILKKSVNTVRLKNHPVKMSAEIIDELYHRILNGEVK